MRNLISQFFKRERASKFRRQLFTPCCSFCQRSYSEAGPMIDSLKGAYICEECVSQAQYVLQNERARKASKQNACGPKNEDV